MRILSTIVLLTFGYSPKVVAAEVSTAADFKSPHLAVGLNPTTPAFSWFAVDSLGKGEGLDNVVLTAKLQPDGSLRSTTPSHYHYTQKDTRGEDIVLWEIEFSEEKIVLRSDYVSSVETTPFVLLIDQKRHAAFLHHCRFLCNPRTHGSLLV